MAKIKSSTDLEQSKKLAEFLPFESADMHYSSWTILEDGEFIISPNYGETIKELQEEYGNQVIPAWSLASLFNILPSGYVIVKNYHSFYFVESRDHEKSTNIFNNPIDACYEMIIKLHELNLL